MGDVFREADLRSALGLPAASGPKLAAEWVVIGLGSYPCGTSTWTKKSESDALELASGLLRKGGYFSIRVAKVIPTKAVTETRVVRA